MNPECFGSLIIIHPHLSIPGLCQSSFLRHGSQKLLLATAGPLPLASERSISRSRYLALLCWLASSILSSQGTVSSILTTCLDDSDVRTISDLSVFLAMWSGNFSCLTRSIFSCYMRAMTSSPVEALCATSSLSPSLTNVMLWQERGRCR